MKVGFTKLSFTDLGTSVIVPIPVLFQYQEILLAFHNDRRNNFRLAFSAAKISISLTLLHEDYLRSYLNCISQCRPTLLLYIDNALHTAWKLAEYALSGRYCIFTLKNSYPNRTWPYCYRKCIFQKALSGIFCSSVSQTTSSFSGRSNHLFF